MPPFDRSLALGRLSEETFDVLVVGGGIAGAGVALDAARRGLRTALVERNDFASGTSSKSSKFVHGGLRYLLQRDYRLVAESLIEQRRLLRNASHLVRPLPVLLPVGGGRAYRAAWTALLSLHDLAGGTGLSRPVPNGVVFHEAQVDDARLTLAVLRTAVLDHGAVAANHCPVVGLEHDRAGRARGALLGDGTRVAALSVVNATGAWAGGVAALDGHPGPRLRPAKGVHITVARSKLPLETALVVPSGVRGSWVFLAPWADRVIIGTTDSDHEGPLDEVTTCAADVAILLEAVNPFLSRPLAETDVLGSWAGLRPLLNASDRRRTAALSRRHHVSVSPSGMVTVIGGKLTTYRRMAADTVDRLGHASRPRSSTTRLALRGTGLRPAHISDHLWCRFGTEAPAVLDLCATEPTLAEPLVSGLPYLRAEAVWAVRNEMARTLDDVLSRRTRALILDRDASMSAAPEVARLLARELRWSGAELDRQLAAYRKLAGLPVDAGRCR